MGRTRKTEAEVRVDQEVGARVRQRREALGLSIGEVAAAIGISGPQLSSLETGRYSFSVGRLAAVAGVLRAEPGQLLPVDSATAVDTFDDSDHLSRTLVEMVQSLEEPQQFMLLDAARRLSGVQYLAGMWRRMATRGRLVSLEGIDGTLIADQANRLKKRLEAEGAEPCRVCDYDFDSPLWGYMIERFAAQHIEPRDPHHDPFERTLLFSCERLYRQAQQIMPAWRAGHLIVVPFFALAASIYQQLEGVHDLILVKVVDNLLLPPNPVIVLDSSPEQAYRRAVPHRPEPGTFYSPYRTIEDFARARELYRAACASGEHPYEVHFLKAEGCPEELAEQIWRLSRG